MSVCLSLQLSLPLTPPPLPCREMHGRWTRTAAAMCGSVASRFARTSAGAPGLASTCHTWHTRARTHTHTISPINEPDMRSADSDMLRSITPTVTGYDLYHAVARYEPWYASGDLLLH